MKREMLILIKMEEAKLLWQYLKDTYTNNEKQIPPNLVLRCGRSNLSFSLKKKLGNTLEVQKEFLETEMSHDGNFADNWRDKKDERFDYVKNDVLGSAISYAGYS